MSLTTFERHARAACYRVANARALRVGTILTRGPVDEGDPFSVDASGEERRKGQVHVILPLSDFSGALPVRQTLVKDMTSGQEYKVRDVERIEDGLTFRMWISEVVS